MDTEHLTHEEFIRLARCQAITPTASEFLQRMEQMADEPEGVSYASWSLLDAVNAADEAMMQVVEILCGAGDPRAKTMIDLQAKFCAPFQKELGN